MAIDIAVALFLLVMCWRGYATGAVRQTGMALALIAGYFIALLSAGQIAVYLSHYLVLGPALLRSLSLLIAWALSTLFLWYLIKHLVYSVLRDEILHGYRKIGFCLGGAKAFLLAYVVLALFAIVSVPWPDQPILSQLGTRSSYSLAMVRQHNLLVPWCTPALGKLRELAEVQAHPRLSADAKQLLKLPSIGGLTGAPDITQALARGNWDFLLSDQRVQLLLKDPMALRQLLESDLSKRAQAADDLERQ